MKAILTIGISASGKSTWAAKEVEDKKPQEWLVINQDEIRISLLKEEKGADIDAAVELKKWNYDPNGESENNVKKRWDTLVEGAISKNFDGIIISDTNLDGGGKKINKLVAFGINPEDISTKEFSITLEDALERDKNRMFSVGPDVLKMQLDRLALWHEKSNNTSKLKI